MLPLLGVCDYNGKTNAAGEKRNQYAAALFPSHSMPEGQLFASIGAALFDLITPKPKRCPHPGFALRGYDIKQTRGCSCRGTLIWASEKLVGDPEACAPNVR